MKAARRFSNYLKEELKSDDFKKTFDDEEIYANVAIQIAKLRQEEGYSQKKLAKILHTTQQTISRIETPHNTSISVSTLLKLARAFKKGLQIRFV